MSDYGRVPIIEIENPQKAEKEIFEKPKEEVDEKKQKLKDHLAVCRKKSAEVRKAKKEERIANKRPRGRPKKEVAFKEPNVKLEVITEELDDGTKVKYPTEKEIFKEPVEEVEVEPPAPASTGFDMDMLLSKLDERIDNKFNAFKPIAPAPVNETQPPQYFKYMKEMKDHEDMIRSDERKKLSSEYENKKLESLQASTKKYFGRMPPANLIPSAEPTNAWDDLLNPRRK